MTTELQKSSPTILKRSGGRVRSEILRNKYTYLLFIPALLHIIVFRFFTAYGLKIAFIDYKIMQGYRSPWVGLDHFAFIVKSYFFPMIVQNTLVLTGMRILLGFPVPIILALLLNEMRMKTVRRTCQTLLYLPHFLNWVVLFGIFAIFFNDRDGVIMRLVTRLGFDYVDFTRRPETIRIWLVGSGIWKNMGWSTIIYLAAISSIDPQLYESAVIDGANRWRQAWHITIPAIFPIMSISLVLQMRGVLNEDFEQIFIFARRSYVLIEKTQVFETYIYGQGLVGGVYSMAAAMGLFQVIIGIFLTLFANWVAGKLGYEVLW